MAHPLHNANCNLVSTGSIADHIEAWNTRPAEDALTAEVERLKKQVADREDEGYAGFVIGVDQMKKKLAEKDKEIARLRLQNMKLKKLINEDLFHVLTNYLPKKQVFSEIIGLLRIKYDCITGKDTDVPANAPDMNDGTMEEK